jgi:hypothetical protein
MLFTIYFLCAVGKMLYSFMFVEMGIDVAEGEYSSCCEDDEDDEDDALRRHSRRMLSTSSSSSHKDSPFQSHSRDDVGGRQLDSNRTLHFSPIRNETPLDPRNTEENSFKAYGADSVSFNDSIAEASPRLESQSDEDEGKKSRFFSFLPGFSSGSSKKKTKNNAKKRKKRKKKKSGDHLRDTHFHSDVNTALQSVEEHIIARVDSPTKEDSRNTEFGLGSLHALDSFVQHVSEDALSAPSSAQEHERSLVLPPEFEMVSPLQQISVPNQQYPAGTGGFMVCSPPTDHHCIPLIPSGGMAALSLQSSSLQSSYASSPAPGPMHSPLKMMREKRFTDGSLSNSITGRLRRLSLPSVFLKSENKANDASPSEQKQDTFDVEQNNIKVCSADPIPSSPDDVNTKDNVSALQLALDKEKESATLSRDRPDEEEEEKQSGVRLFPLLESSNDNDISALSPRTSLSSHIPEPPVPPEVHKSVVLPLAKKPTLTNEEFKQKKLIRKMVYELDLNWRDEDFPVIKRLSWYLLKDIKQVQKGDSLWTGNEEAVAMGLLISGRLEAVTANSNLSPFTGGRRKSSSSCSRTLQVIMPGTLIGKA